MDKFVRFIFVLAFGHSMMSTQSVAQEILSPSLIYYLNAETFQQGRANSVYGVEARGGNVVIGDFRHNRVIVLDSDLKEKLRFDVSIDPHGVAVDKSGNIYVGGYKSPRIQKFDPQGREIAGWDAALVQQGLLKSIADLDVDLDGNLVIVADYGKGIMIKASPDGNFISILSLAGLPNPGTFYPHGIAVGVNGDIYIADREKDVKVFSPDGSFKRAYHPHSGSAEGFDPLTVQFLSPDVFLVPNYKDGKICVFHVEQGFLASVGSKGKAEGQFLSATNLPVDENGFSYVSEEDGNRIQKIDFKALLAEQNVTKN